MKPHFIRTVPDKQDEAAVEELRVGGIVSFRIFADPPKSASSCLLAMHCAPLGGLSCGPYSWHVTNLGVPDGVTLPFSEANVHGLSRTMSTLAQYTDELGVVFMLSAAVLRGNKRSLGVIWQDEVIYEQLREQVCSSLKAWFRFLGSKMGIIE